MLVHVVDPAAYTRPYDHALCAALARAGAQVELVTAPFDYGTPPAPDGYAVRERFYRGTPGRPGSRLRSAARLARHVPDMLAYRRHARVADVVHFQWLPVQPLDVHLLPRGRPLVLTAHDVLPREGSRARRDAQRRLYERVDAVIAHSAHARRRLVDELGIDPQAVEVIPHGAFAHLAAAGAARPLAAELARVERPVVLCFGLIRPYKGVDVLLQAWRGIEDAELWIVGRPRGVDLAKLRATAPPGVRFVDRFVDDTELPALFARADLVVLPYRESEGSGVLATALAFGRPLLVTDVGPFSDVAAQGAAEVVPPGDADALRAGLCALLSDPARRERLAAAAAACAAGELSWDAIARRTLALYERLLSPESPAR